jgi:hypothetical protein
MFPHTRPPQPCIAIERPSPFAIKCLPPTANGHRLIPRQVAPYSHRHTAPNVNRPSHWYVANPSVVSHSIPGAPDLLPWGSRALRWPYALSALPGRYRMGHSVCVLATQKGCMVSQLGIPYAWHAGPPGPALLCAPRCLGLPCTLKRK